jgi:uncharacterized protein (TIGR03067 family)
MRKMIGLVLLAALTLPAQAQDKPAEDEKLVGSWTIVMVEQDDGKQPISSDEVVILFARGSKITMKEKGKPDMEGTFKRVPLGDGKGPNGMDVMVKADGKDQVLRFLYQLDGDSLKLATSSGGKVRSTSFDTKQGEGTVVATFKRQKP